MSSTRSKRSSTRETSAAAMMKIWISPMALKMTGRTMKMMTTKMTTMKTTMMRMMTARMIQMKMPLTFQNKMINIRMTLKPALRWAKASPLPAINNIAAAPINSRSLPLLTISNRFTRGRPRASEEICDTWTDI